MKAPPKRVNKIEKIMLFVFAVVLSGQSMAGTEVVCEYPGTAADVPSLKVSLQETFIGTHEVYVTYGATLGHPEHTEKVVSGLWCSFDETDPVLVDCSTRGGQLTTTSIQSILVEGDVQSVPKGRFEAEVGSEYQFTLSSVANVPPSEERPNPAVKTVVFKQGECTARSVPFHPAILPFEER